VQKKENFRDTPNLKRKLSKKSPGKVQQHTFLVSFEATFSKNVTYTLQAAAPYIALYIVKMLTSWQIL